MPPELTGISTPLTWQIFWQAYPDFLNIGPMWFVVLLLIFSFGYAGWRLLKGNRNSSSESESTAPGYVATGIFIVLLAGASYLFRMVIPLGKIVLQFPSLAYLPQYLSFFIIGAIASRRNWFRTISVSKGVIGFVAALAAGVLLFPLAFSGHWFSLTISSALDNAMGNGHWQSAVYALWDSVFAVGLTMGFITLFRRFINGKGKFGRLLSSQNYAVYVIHIPIVVFIAYALRGLALGSLLKFGVVSLIVVPVCYIAAFLIRRISPVRRVL